ncbi:MAG: DnaJ domain-containing protein, partial [Hyphomonadaceae bacterium]
MSKDPYKILGVARGAPEAEIKKAYRQRAKALHPDLHPNDEAKAEEFKRVSSAFDILSDTKKKTRFDRGEIDGDGNERGFQGGG